MPLPTMRSGAVTEKLAIPACRPTSSFPDLMKRSAGVPLAEGTPKRLLTARTHCYTENATSKKLMYPACMNLDALSGTLRRLANLPESDEKQGLIVAACETLADYVRQKLITDDARKLLLSIFDDPQGKNESSI